MRPWTGLVGLGISALASMASAEPNCTFPETSIAFGYLGCRICKVEPGHDPWFQLMYCGSNGNARPMSLCDRIGSAGSMQCQRESRPACQLWGQIIEVGRQACIQTGVDHGGRREYSLQRCDGPGDLTPIGQRVYYRPDPHCSRYIDFSKRRLKPKVRLPSLR
jgi:hypothetical protein